MAKIVVRQRNQVTIPKSVADEAGIAEGTVCDLQYAHGVITILVPGQHTPIDVMQFSGIGKGLWGSTGEEIDRTISELRDSWGRELPG